MTIELLKEARDDVADILARMIAEGQRQERIEYQRDLLARIDAEIASGGWNPIESAPRDGTDVLIWTKPWPRGSEARFIEGEGWWLANNHPTDHWGDQQYPTHWRPLPTPPLPNNERSE